MQKKLLIIFMLCIFLFPFISNATTTATDPVCGDVKGTCTGGKNCCSKPSGSGFICQTSACPIAEGGACSAIKKCANGLSCSITKKVCVKEIPDFFNLNGKIGVDNVNTLIARIIKYALGIVGTLTLLFFIYGGLMWMTSAGNESKVKKGAKTMGYAFIGLFKILASYLLVDFILKILGE